MYERRKERAINCRVDKNVNIVFLTILYLFFAIQITKMGHKVKGNDEIQIQKEEITKESEPVKMELLPEPELPLVVVYEDEHLAVINKTPGISVHPSPGLPFSFVLLLLLPPHVS